MLVRFWKTRKCARGPAQPQSVKAVKAELQPIPTNRLSTAHHGASTTTVLISGCSRLGPCSAPTGCSNTMPKTNRQLMRERATIKRQRWSGTTRMQGTISFSYQTQEARSLPKPLIPPMPPMPPRLAKLDP